MPKSRQRDREIYSTGARIYAMAANMLEGVDGEEWKARGLSKGDVMFALALGSIHLRILSFGFGRQPRKSAANLEISLPIRCHPFWRAT